MINSLSTYCANLIINQNYTLKQKRDIYIYGIQIIISSIFTLSTIIVTSILLYNWYDAVIFVLFFVPIRLFAGGYHANTYWGCYLCSNFCFNFSVLIEKFISINDIFILYSIFIIISMYLLKTCPVINKNNPINKQEYFKNKLHMKQMLILELITITFLSYLVPDIACKAIYTSILVAFMVYKEKRKGGN